MTLEQRVRELEGLLHRERQHSFQLQQRISLIEADWRTLWRQTFATRERRDQCGG